MRLSKQNINTFEGNIVPLQLSDEKDMSKENIKWSFEGDCIKIRTFEGDDDESFNDGVLITALKAGKAVVFAELNGEKHSCNVDIRATKKFDGEYNHYLADFHIHTTKEHDHENFKRKTTDFPSDCIKSTDAHKLLDCSVITDHASTTNKKEFFRGFVDDELVSHDDLVVFPGCESQVNVCENDRYGIRHKNSGEIVTINSDTYKDAFSWEEFYETFSDSPFVIASLAHPHVVGWSEPGIWDFKLYENGKSPELRRMVKMTEVGKGNYSESCILYHYSYSVALDAGFKLAPCSTSDCHGSYVPCVGKTVLLATEKSKEAFLDAINSNRVYATESGSVKLSFGINGKVMGETLDITDKYKIHVETGLLNDNKTATPVKCTVISDYGRKIKSMPAEPVMDFEIESDTARYFYLLLTDEEGRKTWSAPIWTSRPVDDYSYLESLSLIPSKEFTAFDEIDGKDVSAVVNGDPRQWAEFETGKASVVIDMKKEYEINALGHIAPPVIRDLEREDKEYITEFVTKFVSEYRISVSSDGKDFEEVSKGFVRIYGGEDVFAFDTKKARYIKFEALTTVGRDSELKKYENKNVVIGELCVYGK